MMPFPKFRFFISASSHIPCVHLLFSQIWNLKPGWGSRPDIYVEKSHSDDITGLKFSADGKILLSRSFDGTLKVILI